MFLMAAVGFALCVCLCMCLDFGKVIINNDNVKQETELKSQVCKFPNVYNHDISHRIELSLCNKKNCTNHFKVEYQASTSHKTEPMKNSTFETVVHLLG